MKASSLIALFLAAPLLVPAARAAGKAPPAPRELVLAGTPTETTDTDGAKVFLYPAIFLRADLAKASGIVYLRVDGITVEPGSQADIYLVDPSNPKGKPYDPTNYVGSVATMNGSPTFLQYQLLEVNDFEVEGKKFTARSTLRGMSGFSIAMVVRQGAVKVKRFVLTTKPPP